MKKVVMLISFSIIMLLMSPLTASAEVRPNTEGMYMDIGNGETYTKPYIYWQGNRWVLGASNDWTANTIPITYEVTYNYDEAYKMIDLLNEYRVANGVEPLKANDRLMQVAMERAAQSCSLFAHQIPDGSDFNEFSMFMSTGSENLNNAGDKADGALQSWKESDGHNRNMLRADWKYVGIGMVSGIKNGANIMIFCNGNVDSKGNYKYYEVDGYPDKPIDLDALPYGQMKNYTENYTSQLNPQFIKGYSTGILYELNGRKYSYYEKKGILTRSIDDNRNVEVGDKLTVDNGFVITQGTDFYKAKAYCTLLDGQCTITSSDTNVISVKGNELICKGAGTSVITISLNVKPDIKKQIEVKVYDKEIKNGTEVTVSDNTYKVIDVKKKTVSFIGSDKKKVVIPATVKIQGKTYKVTTVAKNALKNNKTVTKVTIGKNVTKIEKNAFNGCSKLKKITVKSTKIKSVGKNAFKRIHKKATIKVPKSKLTEYKKLFKGKGQQKSVKITK